MIRSLLRLLPASARRKQGTELLGFYREMWRIDVEEGGGSTLGFWLGVIWDLGSTGAAERASRVRGHFEEGRGRMGEFVRDIRLGFRQIVRQPGFSITVMLLVAIGVAGNSAVFRLVNGLFLQPLPFANAERLVDIDLTAPAWNLEYVSVSIGEYRAWHEANPTSLDQIAVYRASGANLQFSDGAERIEYLAATHTIDDVLAIQPTLGRFFDASEDLPEAPRVALLTQSFWESRFAADPATVGRILRLNGDEVQVIGVLPEEASFLGDVDLWIPLREDDQSSFYLTGIGLLSEGATHDVAQAELRRLRQPFVDEDRLVAETSPVVATLRDRYVGGLRVAGGFLMGAVGIVLLIACANIAGLMIARGSTRGGEVAVRRAIGAGRGRIVRQLFSESLVLAAIGGVLGGLVGLRASDGLLLLIADQVPSWVRFELDPVFGLFTIGTVTACALLFGLLPALRTSAGDLRGAGRSTASKARRKGLQGLVAVQVALAVSLLIGAALAMADTRALTQVDPGYDADDMLVWTLQPDVASYPDFGALARFVRDYTARLEALPEISEVVIASQLPLGGHSGWFFEVEGALEQPMEGASEVVLRRQVTPGYISAMGVELAAGRALLPSDGIPGGEQVVVVNETMVRTHLPPNTDPIGQRIRTGSNDEWKQIVGVARDVLHYGVDTPMRPALYEPYMQRPSRSIQVGIRTRGAGAFEAARRVTVELDPGLAMYGVETLVERVEEDMLGRKAASWLLTLFALTGVLLCAAGLYGVISYGVTQRRREIGIRLALGAEAAQVRRSVVFEGLAIAGLGTLVGVGLALVGGRFAESLLVSPAGSDPRVYLGVAVSVIAVTALANWLPALRAARTSPMESLRAES